MPTIRHIPMFFAALILSISVTAAEIGPNDFRISDLNGTTYLGGVSLFTVPDASWNIEAVGDYNGDGKLDLIWRNYSTGAVNVWFLDGTTYTGGASLFNVAGASWEIAGPR